MGEGKKASSESVDMRMVRLADLSSGWMTLRLMILPPTLAVDPRKDTRDMKAMVR